MSSFVVSPVVKIIVAAIGGVAIAQWMVREFRRVNAELERVRAASVLDATARRNLPTLRRDPATGEWRLH